ncbi:MAG TPA: GNAT family N-acetyltransferase [Thermohalobaculum sp.]|nr:GNAT family N-acetyltransferase [Thermohalobaculum sp.]
MTAKTASARTSGTGWTIRRAEAGDAGALHAMLTAMSEDLGCAAGFRCDPQDLLRHGFGAVPLFRVLLAERGGAALGMALYFPEFSTLRGRPGVYLQDLYVRRDMRASGLGRRLLAAVVRDASQAWDAAYLRLCVHETNAGALAFYRRLGFGTDPGERPLWIEGARFSKLGDMA